MNQACSSRKLRICRISSAFVPPWEGLGPGPYELSLAQANRGNEIVVITKWAPDCETLDSTLPFKIHRIRVKSNLFFSFLAAIKFIRLHKKQPFDIIHNHGESALILLLLKRFIRPKVPIVSSVHIVRKAQDQVFQDYDPFKELVLTFGERIKAQIPVPLPKKRDLFFEKIYFGLSDALAVVSKSLKDEIKDAYGISRNVFTILNGVNLESFGGTLGKTNPEEIKIRFGKCRHLILFVGVLNGRKGEFDLIAAMKKVVSQQPDTKLLIIGHGPTKELAVQMTEKLGLTEHISFVPNVPYDDMPYYYKASDMFVLPSYSEGLPKVLLEAMACGVILVASDIHCHVEIIENEVKGYIFETGNVTALSRSILDSINSFKRNELVSSNGNKLVLVKFSWDAVGSRLEAVYRSCL